MPTDLFISHSTADAETARVLVTDFENRGITCWMAPRDIPMGSSYQGEIVSAIERCRAMLLLFSGAANNSEHVLREVELAAQNKKPIYPLRIDASEPAGGLRYMLANKQWVERKAIGNRLVETIEQLLAPERAGEAAPGQFAVHSTPLAKAQPNRSALMIGGGALAAVLLAGGALATFGGWWPPKPGPDPWKEIVVTSPSPGPAAPTPPQPQPAPSPAPVNNTPVTVPPAPDATPPAPSPDPVAPPIQEARLPVAPVVTPTAPALKIATAVPNRGDIQAGQNLFFRECDLCPVMAVVPAGSNMIGSPPNEKGRGADEGPQQTISINQLFAVGRSEISFDEWLACVAEGGCNAYRPGDYEWGYDTRPVINVSWNDAKAYVDWLSRKTGGSYRLLSEAEWEYAARGCTKLCEATPFWFGSDISKARANYDWRYAYDGSPKATPPRRTVPVDAGEANPFGLLHVHGNVREWVEDCWNDSLAGLPKDGSARTTGDCRSHVVRGGSWADEPKDLRTAKRTWEVVAERRAQIGFRVARTLQ